MADQCNLQINVNGHQTFFLNQEIVSTFSKKLRKMIKQEKKKTQMKNIAFIIEDFPGGSNGFELVARFCYNFGTIHITVENVSKLYCASVYLGMSHKLSSFNLVQQVETFLEGMFDWSWTDILISIRNCQPFFHYADSSGLIDKLVTTLLAKIAQNSDISLILSSNSSSSSSPSPESTMITSNPFARSNSSAKTTPDKIKRLSSTSNHSSTTNSNKAWWFDDLSTLSPWVIEKVIRTLGAYGSDNNSLLLTKFLLHYLKIALQSKKTNPINYPKPDYTGLVDTAIYGVILMGKTAFSCRALFGVLRLVSGFGLSNVCRTGLETLIGSTLDSAKLDDLLMFGQTDNETDQGVYDVNLVVRLIKVFVQCEGLLIERLNKVGKLVDQYLAEISPDHNLKISKFIRVAQSLPDLARDCFDGVYRAIDIYLESHPNLSFEERSRLCRCLNYEKLSLEACKDLAKNPRIPPRVAVQALASQKQVNYESPSRADQLDYYYHESPTKSTSESQIVLYGNEEHTQDEDDDNLSEVSQDVKVNIQRMQCRVLELEKLCKEMKGQMSKLVRNNTKPVNFPTSSRPHRLC